MFEGRVSCGWGFPHFEGCVFAIQELEIAAKCQINRRDSEALGTPGCNRKYRLCYIFVEDTIHVISCCSRISSIYYSLCNMMLQQKLCTMPFHPPTHQKGVGGRLSWNKYRKPLVTEYIYKHHARNTDGTFPSKHVSSVNITGRI